MIGKPIEGRPDRFTSRPYCTGENMPAPGGWVITATYPDKIVWDYFPETGIHAHTASDYVLGSDSHDYPPYNEREATAVLDRCWAEDQEPWRDDPRFELHINGDLVLTLRDQPHDDPALNAWWTIVTEVLDRIDQDGSTEGCRNVVRDLKSEHLGTELVSKPSSRLRKG